MAAREQVLCTFDDFCQRCTDYLLIWTVGKHLLRDVAAIRRLPLTGIMCSIQVALCSTSYCDCPMELSPCLVSFVQNDC